MAENQRQHKRIDKRLTLMYCVADTYPRHWDLTVIENISVGGIKFTTSSNLELKNKFILVKIRIPELLPRHLELEALVLNEERHVDGKFSEVRAKFVNLTDLQKKDLPVVENLVKHYDSR